MKIRLSALVLMLITLQIAAAQILKGRITDELTQIYLEGIEVYIPELEKKAITDQFGAYEIKNLPSGKFKIQLSGLNYQNQIKFLEILDGVNVMNAQLKEELITSESVSLSSPYFKSKNENTIKVIEINPNKFGTTPNQNLGELMGAIPGMSNNPYSWSASKPVIRMQDMRKITFVSNGVSFETLPWERYLGIPIPAFGLDKIEIIKGPGSLLYGASSLGGVVYLAEEKPAELNHLEGDVQTFGSYNGLGAVVQVGAKYSGEKFNYGIRIGSENMGDQQLDLSSDPNSRLHNSRYFQNQAKFTAGYNSTILSSKLKITTSSGRNGIISGIGNSTDRLPLPYAYVQSQFLNISHQNTFFISKTRLSANYGGHSYNVLSFAGRHGGDYNSTGYNIDVNWASSLNESSNIIIGGQHKSNIYTPKYTIANYIPNGSMYERTAFFFVNHSDAENKTNIQLGLRIIGTHIEALSSTNTLTNITLGSFSNDYFSPSASVGAALRLSGESTLRINTAAGYRAPNIAELGSNGAIPLSASVSTAYIELGNPNLKQEGSLQFDLGYELKRHNFHFTASLFRYTINNYITLKEAGADSIIVIDPVLVYDQVTANISGFEAQLEFSPYRFKWMVVKSSLEITSGKEDRSSGLTVRNVYLPNNPGNTWMNSLCLKPAKKLWKFRTPKINLELNRFFGRSNLGSAEALEFDGFTHINLIMAGRIPWQKQFLELTIAANNLLGINNPYPIMMETHPDIQLPGRNYLVGLKIPFVKDLTPNKRRQITAPSLRK